MHIPNLFYVKQIAIHAPQGWQSDFAIDMLAVLNPDEYEPATYIGLQALKEFEY